MIDFNPKDLTVKQIEAIVSDMLDSIDQGDLDGLHCYLVGGWLMKLGQLIKDQTYSFAWDEYQLHDEKKLYGVEFQLVNTPAYYDYEADPVYKMLNDQLKDRKALLTKAVKATHGEQIIHEDEIIEKVPMKSPSKETIKLIIR